MSQVEIQDLTFVFHGPLWTEKDGKKSDCLIESNIASVRRHFPGASVVLATFDDEETDSLAVDKVETILEPPSLPSMNDRTGQGCFYNNILYSARSGLDLVETEYAVKVRTDMFFKNPNLLYWLNNRPGRHDELHYANEEYMLCTNWSTVYPRLALKLCHHPSDQIYCGKTTDLITLFSCPDYPKDFVRWFEENPYPSGSRSGGALDRYRGEAWFWYNFVRHICTENFESSYDFSEALLEESLKIMVQHLVILSPRQLGIGSTKYPELNDSLLKFWPSSWKRLLASRAKMMTHLDWAKEYDKFVGLSRRTTIDTESLVLGTVRLLLTLARNKSFLFPHS